MPCRTYQSAARARGLPPISHEAERQVQQPRTGAGKTHSSPDLVPVEIPNISVLRVSAEGNEPHARVGCVVLQAAHGYTRLHFTFRLWHTEQEGV